MRLPLPSGRARATRWCWTSRTAPPCCFVSRTSSAAGDPRLAGTPAAGGRYCRCERADDLVQETFLKAFRHWHTFVPGSDCTRWLAAICRNTCFAQRARQRWVTAVGDDMELETFAAVHLHKLARDRGVEDVFARLDVGPAIREAVDAGFSSVRRPPPALTAANTSGVPHGKS
ncbi:MAG: sigma-70 family RNA polymerase sigma factor [Gemmatimonadaceae bacterium]|nr:sigma-70 family RNA polymerase sigma factor [Gemmatimonadaceae bacterium]